MDDAPHPESLPDLDGKLEPEAKTGCSSRAEAAALSAAISLKRIADLLAPLAPVIVSVEGKMRDEGLL